jgi:hypothetical protein
VLRYTGNVLLAAALRMLQKAGQAKIRVFS